MDSKVVVAQEFRRSFLRWILRWYLIWWILKRLIRFRQPLLDDIISLPQLPSWRTFIIHVYHEVNKVHITTS